MPDSKPFYASKTMWGNLIAGGLAYLASRSPWVKANLTPEVQLQVTALAFVALNFLLRAVTKGAVTLWVALLLLMPLSGCATMQKGVDWYNANGPVVTVAIPGITSITIGPHPKAPLVDAGLGVQPPPPAPVPVEPKAVTGAFQPTCSMHVAATDAVILRTLISSEPGATDQPKP